MKEQLEKIYWELLNNNLQKEDYNKLKKALKKINKKEYKENEDIISKILKIINKEDIFIKNNEIITNILWIKKQDIEKLKINNNYKEIIEIEINNKWRKIELNFDDLIQLSFLSLFDNNYTDIHFQINWNWDIQLLWRKNQILENIKIWYIYKTLKQLEKYLKNNFNLNKDESIDDIINNFLFIIAENGLWKQPKNLEELYDINISTIWLKPSFQNNLIEIFKSLYLLIWNSNQSWNIYDVKVWLRFWNKNFDYRFNFTPIFQKEILFSITWRKLITKNIEFNYWSYNNIVKWVISWKWVVIIWWKTNSWKSTSVFALLNYLHKIEKNKKIISIEDPIEKTFNYIEQLEIKQTWNEKIDLTFNKYIWALVRKDWDYTFIWEIRDKSSLSWIINLANIWYWIFTTTHISNIFWLKTRIQEMWWNIFWLLNSTKSIIVQQLLTKYDIMIDIKNIQVKYKNKEEIENIFEKELFEYIVKNKIWNNLKEFYNLCKLYKITLENNSIYKNSEIKKEKESFENLVKALENINTFYKYISNNFKIKQKWNKSVWMLLSYEIIIFNNKNRKLYLKENENEIIENENKYIPIFLNALITLKNKNVNFLDIIWLSKWF